MAKPPGSAAQFGARLQMIADALGIPVSQFYDERAPPYIGGVINLVRLYAAITDAQGRQRVLSVAQREVERCQAAQEPTP